MTKLRTSAIALVLAASTAAGVTGCSKKEAPKARDAWTKAQDAVGTYKSMEVKASGKSDGKPASATIKGDVDGDPEMLNGDLGIGKLDAVVIGGTSYIKADATYWKSTLGSAGASSSMIDKLAGKWVTSPEKSTSNDSGFKDLVKEIRDDSSQANKKLLSDKATVTADKVGDTDAWKITSEDKKVNAWVSQDDSGEVLKTQGVVKDGASAENSMTETTFVSHDKDYGIKAPSGAKKITDLLQNAG